MNRSVVVATVGALLLLSCKDGNAPTTDEPVAPSLKPTAPTAVHLDRNAVPKMLAGTALIPGPAPRNPHSEVGQVVACFDGTTDGVAGGRCRRWQPTLVGAELETNRGDPRGEYAGVTAGQGVRGKLLKDVIELSFDYAGGLPGDRSPRWSIPISEDNDGLFEPPVEDPSNPGTFLPGPHEEHASIQASTCNHSDAFVGTLDGNDDLTCQVDHKGVAYPNWKTFATAHPTWRVARRHTSGALAFTFIVVDGPSHYLVWNVWSQ